MADYYELETTTDSYQLEDGSGNYLLEQQSYDAQTMEWMFRDQDAIDRAVEVVTYGDVSGQRDA